MTSWFYRRSAIVVLLVCAVMGACVEDARADEKADRRREQQRIEILRQCQAAVDAGQVRQAKAVLLRIRKGEETGSVLNAIRLSVSPRQSMG